MTSFLEIENYKSIKHLKIDCKKVNVFIGEPNTGKSNILEALAFFSPGVVEKDVFNEVIRFKSVGDLFFDNKYGKPIHIKIGGRVMELSLGKTDQGAALNQFLLKFDGKVDGSKVIQNIISEIPINHNGSLGTLNKVFDTDLRYYVFKRLNKFEMSYQPFLSPPYGYNIPNLLLGNDELKQMVSDIFKDKGFRLQLKPTENDINIAKEVNDEIYSYPYNAVSETLQRIIFLMLAIESNTDSVLVFDEPESNTFPFYTKYIAERIALDETNQFFIATHNPYLLMNLIEKTKLIDLNVFVTKMEKFQTKAVLLNNSQVEEVFSEGMDAFFNLETILAE